MLRTLAGFRDLRRDQTLWGLTAPRSTRFTRLSVGTDGTENKKTSPRDDNAAKVSSQLVILVMGGRTMNGGTYGEKSESSGVGNLWLSHTYKSRIKSAQEERKHLTRKRESSLKHMTSFVSRRHAIAESLEMNALGHSRMTELSCSEPS